MALPRATSSLHRGATRFRRALRRTMIAAALIVVAAVLGGRWIDPPITYLMFSEWRRLGSIERDWVPLAVMSEHLPLSAAAAEDAGFCRHWGFDMAGIRAAMEDRTRLRGGSTISQQVAKNVYLWPDRSWLRKALEAGLTLMIEALWPKARIIEVYLNVAEFAPGVFGVEAAARHYWDMPASELGPERSARLMAVLPAPRERSPVSGSAFIATHGAAIRAGAATIAADGRADCLR